MIRIEDNGHVPFEPVGSGDVADDNLIVQGLEDRVRRLVEKLDACSQAFFVGGRLGDRPDRFGNPTSPPDHATHI